MPTSLTMIGRNFILHLCNYKLYTTEIDASSLIHEFTFDVFILKGLGPIARGRICLRMPFVKLVLVVLSKDEMC